MHFFFKSIKLKNKSPSKRDDNQKQVQQQQRQQKVMKKIVVRKRPKKSFQEIQGQRVEDESPHFIKESYSRDKKTHDKSFQGKQKKKTLPVISFMGSEEESLQQLDTPYLHGLTTPIHAFGPPMDDIQPITIEQHQNEYERPLSRTKSKPIEQIQLSSPMNDTFVRRNSFKTDFQSYRKPINKYPTEISSQQDDFSSAYDRSRDVGRLMLTLNKNKEDKISILEDTFSEHLGSGSLQRPKNSQSSKELVRQQQRNTLKVSDTYNFNEQQPSIGNVIPTTNMLQNNFPASFENSRVIFEAQRDKLLTSRVNNQEQVANQIKPMGFTSYIDLQCKELQKQRERMTFYADEANKLLCNADNWQSSPHSTALTMDKYYQPLKYMFDELVQLFCLGEVIKYQLRYRSYQILTKIYAVASQYYGEKIVFEQPIKAYTFSLAIKALLPEYQRSQLDIVVTKLFHSSHLLSYEEFFTQFASLLDSKLAALFQPAAMKKQVDKTLEKVKRLFVVWIEIQYFTKKIREILRQSKVVYDSILQQCSSIEQPSKLDIQLLEKYFLQGEKKNTTKKLKFDFFFRCIIGNQLLKNKWTDWVHKVDVRLYNRYESKLVYQRSHVERGRDRKVTQLKTPKSQNEWGKKFQFKISSPTN